MSDIFNDDEIADAYAAGVDSAPCQPEFLLVRALPMAGR
jgi:hypothetical protein